SAKGEPAGAVSASETTHVFPVSDESVVNDSGGNWRSERPVRGRQDAARVGSGTRGTSAVGEYPGLSAHGSDVLCGDGRARWHRARRTATYGSSVICTDRWASRLLFQRSLCP